MALNTGKLLLKAATAVKSARALLDGGEVDGAADRAYYAMFQTVRAALQVSGYGADSGDKHGRTLGKFNKHMIHTGKVPDEYGKLIRFAFEQRSAADYSDESVLLEDARKVVEDAEMFVPAVCKIVGLAIPPGIDDPSVAAEGEIGKGHGIV